LKQLLEKKKRWKLAAALILLALSFFISHPGDNILLWVVKFAVILSAYIIILTILPKRDRMPLYFLLVFFTVVLVVTYFL
jgi:hypothetical protein